MTIWSPDLSQFRGPRYSAIADALAADVAAGRLKSGERLPTHRDLAWNLKVTVGTVTRAYAEAERRGLIAGEVGRGTYVRDQTNDVVLRSPAPARDGFVDLSRNYPPVDRDDRTIADTIVEVARSDITDLLGYTQMLGLPTHRDAGARWVRDSGVDCQGDHVAVTGSAQQGLMASFAAVARPGDTIVTEQLTFYGVKATAGLMGYRLQGVAIDAHGLVPEALDLACRQHAPKALYCVPNLHNPTTAIMPEARRLEIAEICRRHGVPIIEDDSYGFLLDAPPPPIAALAPDVTIYVNGLSKPVAPGLRIGFLATRLRVLDRIETAMRASTWMATPVMAETAARLVNSGAARRIALWKRGEARARQALAARILDSAQVDRHASAYHLWLHLPEPWRREEFTETARRRGVGVAPADSFAVGRNAVPHAVRVCLSAERPALEAALKTLATLLQNEPAHSGAMV